MNVTLSLDEKVVQRGRQLAAERGTSLNQLIRDYLGELTNQQTPAEKVETLDRMWAESKGDSRGWRWNRDEIHER